jgi:hypothetical protein
VEGIEVIAMRNTSIIGIDYAIAWPGGVRRRELDSVVQQYMDSA